MHFTLKQKVLKIKKKTEKKNLETNNYCLDLLNFLRMYWREKKNELYGVQNTVKALLQSNTCERLLKYTYNLFPKENLRSKVH